MASWNETLAPPGRDELERDLGELRADLRHDLFEQAQAEARFPIPGNEQRQADYLDTFRRQIDELKDRIARLEADLLEALS